MILPESFHCSAMISAMRSLQWQADQQCVQCWQAACQGQQLVSSHWATGTRQAQYGLPSSCRAALLEGVAPQSQCTVLQTWAKLPQAGFTLGKRRTQGWQSPAEALLTAQVVHFARKSLTAALHNELKDMDYILDVDRTAELVTEKGGRLACSRVETLCTS